MAKEEKPVEGGEAPKKSKKLLIIIIAVILLVLVGGGAAAFLLLGKSDHDEEDGEAVTEQSKSKAKKKSAAAAPPVFVPLDPPFTVNLKGGEQYIQVAISIQVEELTQAETVKVYLPKLRSDINNLLSSKSAEELLTVEGKNQLAGEIRLAINRVIAPSAKGTEPEGPVVEVLFTAFIIQ